MENIALELRASKVSSRKKEGFDQLNVLIEIELSDWLNEILRKTKRQNGKKLKKSDVLNILLAWFKENEPDWEKIESSGDLKAYLTNHQKRIICSCLL